MRRRQADGHRSEVGDEGGDDVAVLGATKRPPKLQETREFEECVSSSSKRGALDHKFIPGQGQVPRFAIYFIDLIVSSFHC